MSEIKVGSEWINNHDVKFEVTAVGRNGLLSYHAGTLAEIHYTKDEFLKKFKSAPVRRTVWLNVYEDRVISYDTKDEAEESENYNLLFQQEVELIDPRGEAPA